MSKSDKHSTDQLIDPGPSTSKAQNRTQTISSVVDEMTVLNFDNKTKRFNHRFPNRVETLSNVESGTVTDQENVIGRRKKIQMVDENGTAVVRKANKHRSRVNKHKSEPNNPGSIVSENRQKSHNKNASDKVQNISYDHGSLISNTTQNILQRKESHSNGFQSENRQIDSEKVKQMWLAATNSSRRQVHTCTSTQMQKNSNTTQNILQRKKSHSANCQIDSEKVKKIAATNSSRRQVHTRTSTQMQKNSNTIKKKCHNLENGLKSNHNGFRSNRSENKGKNDKHWSGKKRSGDQKEKYNAYSLFKFLDSFLKNTNLESNCEIKQLFTNFQSSSQDQEFLLPIIETVNKICSSESTIKNEVLRSMCQKRFLQVLQTFILQNIKDIIKTEEGREVCQCFYQNIVQISRFAVQVLSTVELLQLNHALVLMSAVLGRIVESIGFQKVHFDLKEMLILLNDKIGKLVLEKEEVSPSDINQMRQMSVIPTQSDLSGTASELKKNIIEGAYKSVEHYLFVQFMLLREDFIAPLREGIKEHWSFLKNGPFKRKSSVRVYQNVQILQASIRSGKLGHVVKLEASVKWLGVMNQFIFGSLLLFSTDNFQSFFVGTVIEVDDKSRTIMVKLDKMHNSICENLYAQDYEMAVSKVFFEPYFHVLTALRNMNADIFPMEKYIIRVEPNPKPPEYIKELQLTTYKIYEKAEVDIFDPVWPYFSSVVFNPSQHDAFQAALTKEFVTIQGPPGTGKTFLGLQIVTTLLDNVQIDTPILVVCFKNHALDQFLEGILKKTKKIIRIGGRSKNTNLEQFNIKVHRPRYGFREFEQSLIFLASHYFSMQNNIDGLKKHGVVAIDHLLKYIPSHKVKDELVNGILDEWLTEGLYMAEEPDHLEAMNDVSSYPANEENIQLEPERMYSFNLEHIFQESEDKAKIESQIGSSPLECLEEATRYLEQLCIDTPETSSESESICYDGTLEYHHTNVIPNSYSSYECFDEIVKDEDYDAVSDHLSIGSEMNSEIASTKSDQLLNQEDPIGFQSEESCKRLEQTFVDDFSSIYSSAGKNILGSHNINGGTLNKAALSENILSELPQFSFTIRDYKGYCAEYENTIYQLQFAELSDEVIWMINSLEESVQYCKDMIYFLNKMIPSNFQINTEQAAKLYELAESCSVWALTNQQRWSLYHLWIDCLTKDIKKQMIQIEEAIRREEAELELARNEADLKVLQNAKVVGLTTTGAAKLRPMLNKLGAKIVVIEEAAEVLESHVVASLSSQCQHVILIGDHKQLRPNPAVYELCRKFNFDISLFERMVKNGMNCYQLDVQHRMRPEISALIVPSIYSRLLNDASVEQRPNIAGVNGNLFFINHNQPENKIIESLSHENEFEAEYAVNLASYLMKQGYTHEEITILATYKGQLGLINKIGKQQKIPSALKITTVDDFQGEENKIIILSLVRSNEEDSIGFLKTENRVCVALSRARDGLFIIGNMDMLSRNSELWAEIKETLVQQNALGSSLRLYCQNHPDRVTHAESPEEFLGVPEGGCQQMCMAKMACGHKCSYHCHPRDQEHLEQYKCTHPCQRVICRRNHQCVRKCSDECLQCQMLVELKLPCGHSTTAPCNKVDEGVKCSEKIKCVLDCGHEADSTCGMKSSEISKIECNDVCGITLNCGHHCKEKCHAKDKSKCTTECQVSMEIQLDCGHIFSTLCYLSKKTERCEEVGEITFPCGHSHEMECWKKKSSDHCPTLVKKTFPCGHTQQVRCNVFGETLSCARSSKRLLPCGHELQAPCAAPLSSLVCKETCTKMAACGHPCSKLCSTPCKCNVVLEEQLTCGHTAKYPCGTTRQSVCRESCTRVMDCGHTCPAQCFTLCDQTKCPAVTHSTIRPACGHGPVDAPCRLNHTIYVVQLTQWCKVGCETSLSCGHKCNGKCGECFETQTHPECNKPCDKILLCGHQCPGKCGECFKKQTHGECTKPCVKTLPCGHKCAGKCKELCLPCQSNCLNRCSHVKCTGICGEFCTPCKEMCTAQCVHSRCTRPCSYFCSRRPCDLPCPQSLACGHPCLGFCGEVCPQVCSECVPRFAATSKTSRPRFIVLEDCGHIMVASDIDSLFRNSFFQIVKCPLESCQEPIVGTQRYRNSVRRIFSSIGKNKKQMKAQIAMAEKQNQGAGNIQDRGKPNQLGSSSNRDRNYTPQRQTRADPRYQNRGSQQYQNRGEPRYQNRGYSRYQMGAYSQQQRRFLERSDFGYGNNNPHWG